MPNSIIGEEDTNNGRGLNRNDSSSLDHTSSDIDPPATQNQRDRIERVLLRDAPAENEKDFF